MSLQFLNRISLAILTDFYIEKCDRKPKKLNDGARGFCKNRYNEEAI